MFNLIHIYKNGVLYDYAPYYFASYEGDIFSLKSGIMKKRIPCFGKTGYNYICLSKNGIVTSFLIHRIIATLFVHNPDSKPCVNHKDGNKNNNRADNLEWVTYSENELHSYKKLGKINPCPGTGKFGVLNSTSKPIIATKGLVSQEFESISMCAKKLGVFDSNINKVLKGRYKHTGGYTFKYA